MLSSNPAFTSSQVISLAFHQPAPLTAPANPSTQGTQSTQRPHLSIVLFLKNDPRNKFVATPTHLLLVSRFSRRIHIMLLCRKTVKPFREKNRLPTEKNYWAVTRANLRLPTCATTVLPLAIVSALSVTFSPSSAFIPGRRPRRHCRISRRAIAGVFRKICPM